MDTTRGLLAVVMLVASTGCGVEGVDGADPLGMENEVVYGRDNRQDVYAHRDPALVNLAKTSVAAVISAGRIISTDPSNIRFSSPTLKQYLDLCSDQRFLDDPTVASCSSTLIADDLVLTAGHCITTTSCASKRFVFGYYREAEGQLNTITSDDVFRCAGIVARVETDTVDYAIVRLDRPATPRFVPAVVPRAKPVLAEGDGLAMIGFPSGIPAKIDSGGRVRDPRANTGDFFIATTDSFGGNSGSGVFRRSDNALVGILVRGETDYVFRNGCAVVKTCATGACAGEDSTYAYRAIAALCQREPEHPLCAQ